MQQPQPQMVMQQPQPQMTMVQPQMVMQQPQPQMVMQQPQPQMIIQQPTMSVVPQPQLVIQPQMTVVQPQPTMTVIQPQPTVTVVQPQPTQTVTTTVTFLEKAQSKNAANYIIMIDKSGSMTGRRWVQSSQATATLARACCRSSPEGITVYFFGSPGQLKIFTGIKSSQQVTDLFNKNVPQGTTCLEGALAHAFNSHFQRPNRLKIPTSILVITDGEPNSKRAVVNEIVSATFKCQSPTELTVSFMQVGDDAKCGHFFRKLDKSRLKSKYAIVDTMSYHQVRNLEDYISSVLK